MSWGLNEAFKQIPVINSYRWNTYFFPRNFQENIWKLDTSEIKHHHQHLQHVFWRIFCNFFWHIFCFLMQYPISRSCFQEQLLRNLENPVCTCVSNTDYTDKTLKVYLPWLHALYAADSFIAVAYRSFLACRKKNN